MIIFVWSSKTERFFKNQGVVWGHSWVWTSRQSVGPWTLRFSTNENKWLGAFIYRGRGLWMLNNSHVILKPLNRFFFCKMRPDECVHEFSRMDFSRKSQSQPCPASRWLRLGWKKKIKKKKLYTGPLIFFILSQGFLSFIHVQTLCLQEVQHPWKSLVHSHPTGNLSRLQSNCSWLVPFILSSTTR